MPLRLRRVIACAVSFFLVEIGEAEEIMLVVQILDRTANIFLPFAETIASQ